MGATTGVSLHAHIGRLIDGWIGNWFGVKCAGQYVALRVPLDPVSMGESVSVTRTGEQA